MTWRRCRSWEGPVSIQIADVLQLQGSTLRWGRRWYQLGGLLPLPHVACRSRTAGCCASRETRSFKAPPPGPAQSRTGHQNGCSHLSAISERATLHPQSSFAARCFSGAGDGEGMKSCSGGGVPVTDSAVALGAQPGPPRLTRPELLR